MGYAGMARLWEGPLRPPREEFEKFGKKGFPFIWVRGNGFWGGKPPVPKGRRKRPF